MKKFAGSVIMGLSLMLTAEAPAQDTPDVKAPLDFDVKLETAVKHDDGKWFWFHPRAAAIPGEAGHGTPVVMITCQKLLNYVSDYYSGLHVMRTDNLGKSWAGPEAVPELDWTSHDGGIKVSVCDVTPGWHPPSGKLLAIGGRIRYDKEGLQLGDEPRSYQTAYAVYDPLTQRWSAWKILRMPPDKKFDFAWNACAQWLVQQDGTLLVPFYFGPSISEPLASTVVQCSFDGEKIKYEKHGDELSLDDDYGLVEPSIACLGSRYYLTMRNDLKNYVTVSDDGLHFQPVKPWTFDDGKELGSYNTQQHWLVHSDGLFLVYTRRGAGNDHIMRHRAPLFMGRVDPDKLCVIRESEKIVVPQRGATLGNFGAATINANESWVTVSESLFHGARKHGADGSTFVARILWSKPNRLALPEPGGSK